jgi:hypothetical protein
MASHNTSKYHANTIVMWRKTMRYIPVFVESKDNSNEAPDVWRYSVTDMNYGTRWVPEYLLHPMTFDEFASFTNPKTGAWMVGRTRGWMAVVIHALSLLGIVAGIVEAAMGNLAALSVTGISLAVLVLFWVFTYRNFKGTTL